MRDCLKNLIDGDVECRVPDPSFVGIWVFLKNVWLYTEISLSGKASLLERVKNASIVCHFLSIWHNYVHRNENVHKNFLSRETYTDIDVLLSCHHSAVVILICYMCDNFPDVPCYLQLTGSDCCECFFSQNGQWIGNYTFAHMERNRNHMIRLEEIRVNPNAPSFARPHPTGEFIWDSQYAPGWQAADLADYPALGTEAIAWNDGAIEARRFARMTGMFGDNPANGLIVDDNDDDDAGDQEGGECDVMMLCC